MKQTIALIASTLLSVSVQSQYIVANSYAASGCDGKPNQISSINTGQCYNARQECATNKDIQPLCDYLKRLAIGDEISFIATCENDQIMAKAFKADGCTDASKAVGTGSLAIPTKKCLLNFQLACSNNPKLEIQKSSASTNTGSILGLLGLLII